MEEKRLEELFKTEGRKLFNMVLRMVRQREEAEDLYQEIFTSFYQNMERVEPKAYKSYLYRTAYNMTLNRIKKLKRINSKQQSQLFEPVYHEERKPEKRNQMIKDSLAELKPAEALLIDLQFYQKKSYQEISEITGHSTGSIDSRLVRAKRKLRQILLKKGIKNVQEDQFTAVL